MVPASSSLPIIARWLSEDEEITVHGEAKTLAHIIPPFIRGGGDVRAIRVFVQLHGTCVEAMPGSAFHSYVADALTTGRHART